MNYSKLGFKSGIEIHAQLSTSKLFCRCPSVLRQDEPHFVIKRELRPLAGETGEVDVAAAYEKAKKLHYLYEGYDDTTCLVELDEAPPREVNIEALHIGLTLAKMMHCKLPHRAQVMRKTVVDGSNTSGFQRTMLVGHDGYIKVGKKRIGINYLILEEDAARRVAEDKKSVTYRLDRLGIPLLEIVTAPDMKTPDEVKEVAKYIGMLLKSTGKAMGGLGSIRQDINISIKGHCRVELKGVQDLKLMQKYIDEEIKRQQTSKKDIPHVRNVKPDFSSKFLRPLPTAARMYPETDIRPIELGYSGVELPELLITKQRRYVRLVGKELASQLVGSKHAEFDKLAKKFKLSPKHIASVLMSTGAEVRKKLDLESFKPRLEDFEHLFSLQSKGKVSLQAGVDVFLEVAKGSTIQDAAAKFSKLTKADLKKEIARLKKKFAKVPEGKLKGIIIGQLRDRADVKDILKQLTF
tara:strand:- start:378 stop:1772 length:1395 start_codon:yes stop_codon:yes gene_type:complete